MSFHKKETEKIELVARPAEADGLCQLPGSETLPDVTKTLHKLGFLTVGTKLGVLGCCRVKVTHTHYPIVGKDLQNVHLSGENAARAESLFKNL